MLISNQTTIIINYVGYFERRLITSQVDTCT